MDARSRLSSGRSNKIKNYFACTYMGAGDGWTLPGGASGWLRMGLLGLLGILTLSPPPHPPVLVGPPLSPLLGASLAVLDCGQFVLLLGREGALALLWFLLSAILRSLCLLLPATALGLALLFRLAGYCCSLDVLGPSLLCLWLGRLLYRALWVAPPTRIAAAARLVGHRRVPLARPRRLPSTSCAPLILCLLTWWGCSLACCLSPLKRLRPTRPTGCPRRVCVLVIRRPARMSRWRGSLFSAPARYKPRGAWSNGTLSGGGSPGPEQSLLLGLQALLAQHSSKSSRSVSEHELRRPQKGNLDKGKGVGNDPVRACPGKGPGKGKRQRAPNKTNQEKQPLGCNASELGLLEALTRLIERASKDPTNLLNRVQTLVRSAAEGKPLQTRKQKSHQPKEAVSGTAKSTWSAVVSQPAAWQTVQRRTRRPVAPAPAPSRLLPSAWPAGSILPEQTVRDHLQRGDSPPGSISWVKPDSVDMLRTLAETHAIQAPFALCVLATDDESRAPLPGAERRLLPTSTSKGIQTLQPFWLWPLNKQLPQLASWTVKSSCAKVERKLATIRVQVPKALVGSELWAAACKGPVAQIRQLIPPDCFHSSYRWAEVSLQGRFGQEHILEGFLKVDASKITKVLQASGRKGFFLSQITKEQPQPSEVSWVQRLENEDSFQYFCRAQQLGHSKGFPLSFRLGGKACLGLRGCSDETVGAKVWQVEGVPRRWNAQDLQNGLNSAGCTDSKVVRPRLGKSPWLVRLSAPALEKDKPMFGIQTEDGLLTLTRPRPQKVQQAARQHVKPGRWALSEDFPPLPAMAPPSAKDDKEPEAKKQRLEAALPFRLLDAGGMGNCGWLCICAAMALRRGKSEEDALKTAAAAARTLRCDLQQHMRKHGEAYRPYWAPDPDATKTSMAGAVPNSYDAWVDTLTRDGQWLCGLAMQGLARRLGIRLVVVCEDKDGTYQPPRATGSFVRDAAPIILRLKDQHFQLVLPRDGHELPKEWVAAKDLGQGPPPVRGAGAEEAVRDWSSYTPSPSPCKAVRDGVSPPISFADGSPVTSGGYVGRFWNLHTPEQDPALASGSSTGHPTNYLRLKTKTDPGTVSAVLSAQGTGLSGPLGPKDGEYPPGRLGTIVEVTQTELEKRPWWTCNLCGFQVFQLRPGGKYSAAHMSRRVTHLRRVHGITKPPKLSQHDISHVRVRLAAQQRWNREVAWPAVWREYMQKRWKGGHRVECAGVSSRARSGFIVWKQRCTDCEKWIIRGDIPKANPCPQTVDGGTPPTKSSRIKLWRGFQKKGKEALAQSRKERYACAMTKKERARHASAIRCKQRQLSKEAAGTSMTRRGKRGVRVGEASHPGPSASPKCEHPLGIWSCNISSWKKHGESLLQLAAEQRVNVVCAQETNLQGDATASAMWSARRQGWQVAFLPPFGSNRGDLAVAVREPLAVALIDSFAVEDGQNLQVEIHGLQHPFRLFNVYQRPKCWNREVFNPMAGVRDFWVCCGDFNSPVQDLHLGLLLGTGRHTSGSQAIDGIWVSPQFVSSFEGGESPSFGSDHTVAWARLLVPHLVPQGGARWQSLWKFRKNRASPGVTPNLEEAEAAWRAVASPVEVWQRTLAGTVEELWKVWTQDFEQFLARTGQIRKAGDTCLIGAVPSLVSAGHKGAPGQCHRERELRRSIRRANEALLLSRRGVAVPPGLLKNLQKGTPARNRGLVDEQRWSPLEAELRGQLDEVIATKTRNKQSAWQESMQEPAKAIAWVKQAPPPPFLLEQEDGTVVAGQAAGLQALFPYWAKVFGRSSVPEDPSPFLTEYAEVLPQVTAEHVWEPLKASALRKMATTMLHKAEGPDGISAKALLSLPPGAWTRLSDMLGRFEQVGSWPQALHHWRVCFLPKDTSAKIDKFRPISVGSIIYRLWAKCQVKRYGALIDPHLGPLQSRSACDCEVMHLALQAEYPTSEFGYGLALDFAKAFDSVSTALGLALLQRVGIPQQVLALLGDQWLHQQRWLSLGGVVHPKCMTGVTSLPQGDPWSPHALSLVLSCPTKRCATRFPRIGCAVYLDDRTLVSSDLASLQAAYEEWEVISQVTRLRTNTDKTQLWARSAQAATVLETEAAPFRLVKASGGPGLHTGRPATRTS